MSGSVCGWRENAAVLEYSQMENEFKGHGSWMWEWSGRKCEEKQKQVTRLQTARPRINEWSSYPGLGGRRGRYSKSTMKEKSVIIKSPELGSSFTEPTVAEAGISSGCTTAQSVWAEMFLTHRSPSATAADRKTTWTPARHQEALPAASPTGAAASLR